MGEHTYKLSYIISKAALSLSHQLSLISLCSNMFDKQERTNEACRVYAEALVELCKQMDIKVIDLWTGFQHRDDWGAAYLRYITNLHPWFYDAFQH